MWSLVPLKARITAVVIAAGFVVAFRMVLLGLPIASAIDLLKSLLSAAGAVALAGLLLGRWGLAWSLPCALGLGRWFPDLNGTWVGKVKSSYTEAAGLPDTAIELRIVQRWSGLCADAKSASGYSESTSVHVLAALEERKPVLWVNFVSRQDAPKPTDESRYFGSARLVFDSESGCLKGPYWTNRASHITGSGGTAGTICLIKRP
jgi:hypothetical protein